MQEKANKIRKQPQHQSCYAIACRKEVRGKKVLEKISGIYKFLKNFGQKLLFKDKIGMLQEIKRMPNESF